MPSLDITFTLAAPVSAAQLVGHMEAYRITLPAMNTLRLCNRFGKGPQAYINRLPVEIVQQIAHHAVVPVRKERAADWAMHLLCYEDRCRMLDHHDRDGVVDSYLRYGLDEDCGCDEDACSAPPNDNHLNEFICDNASAWDDGGLHDDRRSEWEAKLANFQIVDRPLFQIHFGLDIWLSRVCLGTSSKNESADTTVAYLIMRDRAVQRKKWSRHMSEDGYLETSYQSGYGVTVSMDQRATPDEIQIFKRAMRLLGLDVSIHETQSQDEVLSLAPSTKKEQPLSEVETAASYPRPTLLIRNHVEGE
jgi:hypothetical protein